MTDATREEVTRLLAEKMLDYSDYEAIPVDRVENEAKFVRVNSESAVLDVAPIGQERTEFSTVTITLRSRVADQLHWAGSALRDIDPSLRLRVVYGFRPLSEQKRLFDEAVNRLSGQHQGKALLSAAHREIALPSVAGHPTGGAVDVQILRDGAPIEMGGDIWDFTSDAFTFSPFVSREAWNNRQLLRRAMMAVGFAPFDGEWWHFSYGDKEWARYYGHPAALFDQVEQADTEQRDTTVHIAGSA